jgi:hypothetical protein
MNKLLNRPNQQGVEQYCQPQGQECGQIAILGCAAYHQHEGKPVKETVQVNLVLGKRFQ